MKVRIYFQLGFNAGEYSSTSWKSVSNDFFYLDMEPRIGEVLFIDNFEWKIYKIKHNISKLGGYSVDVYVERVVNNFEEYENYRLEWDKIK